MSGRLRCARCVCAALPARLLDHIATTSAHAHVLRHADQRRMSEGIRSERHARMADASAPEPGDGERFIFDAGGAERLPGRLVRPEGARAARDAAVNDAYRNIGITLDFFLKVFGRNSLDAHGLDVTASAHYGENFANAMWNGRQILFGDGDGVHIGGFAKSLGIVAHELSHAVTQHAIPGGLGVVRRKGRIDLAGQAGALNESFSDVFASLVKQWHAKQDARQADWLLGEGVLAPAVGRAVRSLRDPGNPAVTYAGDHQVRDMGGWRRGGDAHGNSGIPNHAFYLAATALGGKAWEHAGTIWYHAIPLLKSRATFRDAARATVSTAARLFGAASREQQAVRAAWQQVGVAPA